MHEFVKRRRDISEEEVEVLKDLISKMLVYDPLDRITAKEVADHEWFDWRYP